MFGTEEAMNAGLALFRLRTKYSKRFNLETELDPIFFGYLTGRYPKIRVSRQFHVRFASSKNPSRIDFRIGGTNPTLLELAVRPPEGTQQLNGPQNHTELKKLSKFPNSEARRRILLLIDLKNEPIDKETLEGTYKELHAGRGNRKRHPVTVVYVHENRNGKTRKSTKYWFTWNPYAQPTST